VYHAYNPDTSNDGLSKQKLALVVTTTEDSNFVSLPLVKSVITYPETSPLQYRPEIINLISGFPPEGDLLRPRLTNKKLYKIHVRLYGTAICYRYRYLYLMKLVDGWKSGVFVVRPSAMSFSREKTPRMTEYGGELALRVDIMVDGTTHHKL